MTKPQIEEAPALPVFETPAYSAPRVNLLPPEIGERRALRKLQSGLAVGVLAAAAVVGVLAVQAGSGKADAQARLDAAVSQQSVLNAQTAKYANVSAQKAAIDAARASLKTALGSEVLWSKTLDNVRLRLPDNVRYQSVAVVAVPTATSGTPTAATTPATAVGAAVLPANAIATATFTGVAVDLNAVATELDQLALVPGVSNVYLTSTTRAAGSTAKTVTFTATADVTNSVLSHRYDALTGATK